MKKDLVAQNFGEGHFGFVDKNITLILVIFLLGKTKVWKIKTTVASIGIRIKAKLT